jgi:hypothetical protein
MSTALPAPPASAPDRVGFTIEALPSKVQAKLVGHRSRQGKRSTGRTRLGWLGEEHTVGFADRLLHVEQPRIKVEATDAQAGDLTEAEPEHGADRNHGAVLDRQLGLEASQVVSGEDSCPQVQLLTEGLSSAG